MRRKKKAEPSALQQAASKRNWRLMQAKGCKTFFESLGLTQTGADIFAIAKSEIEIMWKREKELAEKS